MESVARYAKLMADLLQEREARGGALSDEEESRRIEELDRVWWGMTKEEQAAYEDGRASP